MGEEGNENCMNKSKPYYDRGGTTLMCAKQLGRKAIGIEIEEKHDNRIVQEAPAKSLE